MPESPDFEQIAREILEPWIDEVRFHGTQANPSFQKDIDKVAEQLRQVWNARGAADLAKVEAVFLDGDIAGPDRGRVPPGSPINAVLKDLDRALRSLDR